MDYYYPRRSSGRLSPPATDHSQRDQTSPPAFGKTAQTSSSTTTTNSSSYPSPTDSASAQTTSQPSISSQHRYNLSLPFQPSMSQIHMDPPLPSPSTTDIDPAWARPHFQSNPHQPTHPHPQQQRQQQQQPEQQQPPPLPSANSLHHNPYSQNRRSFNAPTPLPADFLAEAAKRAQMACLMRDLGEVSL